jgi:hypothetical protein
LKGSSRTNSMEASLLLNYQKTNIDVFRLVP